MLLHIMEKNKKLFFVNNKVQNVFDLKIKFTGIFHVVKLAPQVIKNIAFNLKK